MKRWKKILLGIVTAILALLIVVCIWQWNNIQAIYTFLTLDSTEIAQNLEEKREEHHRALQEMVGEITVDAPTTEQSDAILSGQVTPEEVKDELGITAQLTKAETEEQNPDVPGPTVKELINSCIAELYSCKIDIMSMLAEMKRAALEEWNSLAPEERTSTRLKEIGIAGLGRCYQLEETINTQVRAILDRYREQFNQIGGDVTVLDALWSYYEDEKAAEKAYYLDKYMN